MQRHAVVFVILLCSLVSAHSDEARLSSTLEAAGLAQKSDDSQFDSTVYQLRLRTAPGPDIMNTATLRLGRDPALANTEQNATMEIRGSITQDQKLHLWSWQADPQMRGPLIAALENSAALRAAVSDVDVAHARTLRAMAAFLPVIRAEINTALFPNGQSSDPFDNYTNGKVTLSMPLFTSGQNWNALAGARANERAARLEARSKSAEIVQEALANHVEANLARQQKAIASENLALMKNLGASVSKRMNAGLASRADLAEIEANIAAAQREVSSAQGRLDVALDAIANTTGGSAKTTSLELRQLEKLFDRGKGALLAKLRSRSSVIAAANERARAAEYQKRAAYGKYLPRVDLSGEYERVIDQNSTGSIDPNQWSVQVRLSVPLVDFGTMSDVKEARAIAASAGYRAQDAAQQVEKRLSANWENFNAIKSGLMAAEREEAASKRVLVSRQKQYDAGLVSVDAIATQVRNLSDIRSMKAQIAAEKQLLILQLAGASGLLDQDL